MRVSMLTSWNERCGIAEYSRHLVRALRERVEVDVAFGDGSVQFIGKKIDIRVFARLITRDKAEALSREDLGF